MSSITPLTGDAIRSEAISVEMSILAATFADTVTATGTQGNVAAPAATPAELVITPGSGSAAGLFVAPGFTFIDNGGSTVPVVLSGNTTQGPLFYEGATAGQTVFLGTGDAYALMTGFGNVVSTAVTGGGVYEIVAGVASASTSPLVLAPTITGSAGAELGNTIVAASGNANIAAGLGANVIFLGSGIDVVASEGTDTIVGGSGSANILATGDAIAFQGSGDLYFANSGGISTVVGANDMAAAPLTVLGGTGAVTAFGGTNSGDLLAGGTGGHNVLVANASGDSLFGGGSNDVLVGYGGDSLVASSGNTTLFGGFSGPGDSIFGGSGNDMVIDGSGNDLVQVGTGTDQIFAGSGSDDFSFVNGGAGGTDLIVGFNTTTDLISLTGYASGSAALVLSTETVAGGNTQLALPDNTRVTLFGVTDLTAANFHAF